MFAAAPATPLPFSTVTVTDEGGGAFVFTFLPRAAAFASFDAATSGFENDCTAFWMSSVDAWQPRLQTTFSILFWKTCPAGQAVREKRVVVDLLALQLAPSLRDLDVAA